MQILPTSGNKIIIVHEQQPSLGSWDGLVGGRMDEGEIPLEAAKRELLEETGMTSNKWLLIKTFDYPHSQIDWQIYLFIAKDCKKIAKQHLDPGEKIKVRVITLNQLLKMRGRLGPDIMLYFSEIRNDKKRLNQFRKKLFV